MGVYNKGCVTICTGIGPSIHWFCRNFQTPPDLVVDHWTSDVESSSPLDFRLLHAMWTPFGCLMSYKIRPIISVACDFTTKSGGIWFLFVLGNTEEGRSAELRTGVMEPLP